MKIGYVTFGKDDYGYGISYILKINNIDAKRASLKTAKEFDILLFSIFWWAHVYRFVKFCVDAGIGNKRDKPHIIVGGFNSFNPHVFFPWAHQVVVGDGEDVIKSAVSMNQHESIFTGKEKSVIYANADISKNNYVYDHTDIARIEIARGCKYKCPYCQLTYLKPYREVHFNSVCSAIDSVDKKRVALFAPNGMSHKNYDQIAEYAREKGLSNIASDVRYNEINDFKNNNTARMGLEGLSYRLRKSVTKPITDDKFIELIKTRSRQCRDNGLRPSLHTYFILDLPGETDHDWLEFNELLDKVDSVDGINDFTWIITGNVFMPGPHTPYESESIHIDRDYSKKWKAALSDRNRLKPFNFTLTGRHSVFSPYSRLLSMIATRGGPESSEIIYNIVSNEKLKKSLVGRWEKSLSVLIRFLKNYGGAERYIEKYDDDSKMPWKVVKMNK